MGRNNDKPGLRRVIWGVNTKVGADEALSNLSLVDAGFMMEIAWFNALQHGLENDSLLNLAGNRLPSHV